MKKETIRELTEKYRDKYARLSYKKARGALLTQYCEITGYTRKYAQKLLSGKRDGSGEGRRKNKGRPRKYTEEDKRIIRAVWDKTGYWSGRRLKSALRLWLQSWNNDKRREQLGEEQKQRISGISAAQIDRFIREYRQSKPREKNWRIGHSVDAVKGLIEQRSERWDVHEPGWLEADCVALCGGDMSGSFVWLLTITDVWSGWTEVRAMWNRSARKVIDHYGPAEESCPFKWLGIDTDNGGEFMSWETIQWSLMRETIGSRLHLTRSRAGVKNDQAYVEEKNLTHCRDFFGYDRYGYQQIMGVMQELCVCWSLYNNLYRPQLKQLSREKIGSKVKRRHEACPLTPAERIMQWEGTEEATRQALEKALRANDPFKMVKMNQDGLRRIWQMIREMDEKAANSELERDEIAQRYGKLNLRYAPIELAISRQKS